MTQHMIKATIKGDGTVTFDQEGYEGKECAGAGNIQDLIDAMGKETEVTDKPEFFQPEQVHNQENF